MLPSYGRLFALAVLVGYAWALPGSGNPPHKDFKVKESLLHPPTAWSLVGEAPPDHTISLRIGLPQSDFVSLEQHLFEVSDPDHPRYGQHLSKEAVEELVAPPSDSLKMVNEWLKAHGFEEVDLDRSPAKDWVGVKVPVKLAEEMLGTTYHIWKHDESGDTLVRTTSYSLPSDLHDHIDVIQPTTMFSRFNPLASTLHIPPGFPSTGRYGASTTSEYKGPFKQPTKATDPRHAAIDPSCSNTITLKCLHQLYNTDGYVPQVPEKNSIGITGYLEQYANEVDLKLFYEDQLPEAVNSTFKVISIKGGLNTQDPAEAGFEANLDVQFAFGLSYPTPGTFWTVGGRPPFNPIMAVPENTNEPYADWLDYVLKQKQVPYSISTSYGEPEQTVPEAYARRVCNSFAQLSARGVSVLFASGDGGVGDNRDDPNDHRCWVQTPQTDNKNVTRFLPTFPSSCPYVTSVGGTTDIPETSIYFSGGGFSDYWPRQSWQESHVSSWFKNIPADLYKGLYNPAGRAFPDVAAQGTKFRVFWRGDAYAIGGTSASTPAFAAIVALLNDVRIAKGKPPLGFLNPVLYKKGYAGLNDITGGHPNPGCGTQGFNATEGWDPVTGLGTPDFVKLKALLT